MTTIGDLAKSKGLEWKVVLATDTEPKGKTFTVYAFSRADAISVAKVKWGPGSAWTFVLSAAKS